MQKSTKIERVFINNDELKHLNQLVIEPIASTGQYFLTLRFTPTSIDFSIPYFDKSQEHQFKFTSQFFPHPISGQIQFISSSIESNSKKSEISLLFKLKTTHDLINFLFRN